MKPIWDWFGCNEPNYTYLRNGKKLLTEIAGLSPALVHIRTHNLMNTAKVNWLERWGSTILRTYL